MSNANAVQGDVNRKRVYKLSGTLNLATVISVEAHVWKNGTIATLAATVTDPVNRLVEVNLGVNPGDWLPAIPIPGPWAFEIECTFGDGSILTWPEAAGHGGSTETITVRKQGD